jgi:hypothetical protein
VFVFQCISSIIFSLQVKNKSHKGATIHASILELGVVTVMRKMLPMLDDKVISNVSLFKAMG